MPDWPFHNFRASRSRDRRVLFSLAIDFEAPKLWKGWSGNPICTNLHNPQSWPKKQIPSSLALEQISHLLCVKGYIGSMQQWYLFFLLLKVRVKMIITTKLCAADRNCCFQIKGNCFSSKMTQEPWLFILLYCFFLLLLSHMLKCLAHPKKELAHSSYSFFLPFWLHNLYSWSRLGRLTFRPNMEWRWLTTTCAPGQTNCIYKLYE